MSALATEVVEAPQRAADDLEHLFCCCTPTVAVCGASLDGESVCMADDCGHTPCEACAGREFEVCIICNDQHVCEFC